MTDFAADTRHYCRNPRCRSKLPAPVANARDAFCTRGCHSGFYRTRRLVCEAKMERRTENQLICGKRRCRNALQARQSLGRYHAPSAVKDPLKTSIKPGIKTDVAANRPWRIVAGQELTAEQLHCATIADGPNCEWKGGEYQRIEARNRALLREHIGRLSAKALIQRHHVPDIDLSPIATAPALAAVAIGDGLEMIPDDLSIPAFLRRTVAAG
jgi:hypothetical protein